MAYERGLILPLSWIAGVAALVGLWFAAAPTRAAAAEAEQETAIDTIATQIRRQGFPCESPKSAVRDRELSKPDQAVWVLRCENATYRVRLVPDRAARVERVN